MEKISCSVMQYMNCSFMPDLSCTCTHSHTVCASSLIGGFGVELVIGSNRGLESSLSVVEKKRIHKRYDEVFIKFITELWKTARTTESQNISELINIMSCLCF